MADFTNAAWFTWSHRGSERATVVLKARFSIGPRGPTRAAAGALTPRELLPHASRAAVLLVGAAPEARLRVTRGATLSLDAAVSLARVRPVDQAWPRALPDSHDFRTQHVVPPELLVPYLLPDDVLDWEPRGGRPGRFVVPSVRCDLEAEVAGSTRPVRVTAVADLAVVDMDAGAIDLVYRGLVPLPQGTRVSAIRAATGRLVDLAAGAEPPAQSTLPAQHSATPAPLPFQRPSPQPSAATAPASPPPSVALPPLSRSPSSTLPVDIAPLAVLPFRQVRIVQGPVLVSAPKPVPAPPAPEPGDGWTPDRVLARLDAEQDLSGLDLSGLDLSGFCFDGVVMDGVDLTGANLRGASFVRASLAGATLVGADLSKADLSRAVLEGARLDRAKLAGAELNLAKARGASFRACDASDCTFWHADCSDTQWEDAKLARAMLLRADLEGAALQRADLTAAHLRKCKLRCADLDGARLDGADLRGADLAETRLGSANLEAALQEISLQFHS